MDRTTGKRLGNLIHHHPDLVGSEEILRRDFLKSVGMGLIASSLLLRTSRAFGVDLLRELDGGSQLAIFKLDPKDRVVILGGGFAGLTAAYTLLKSNIPFSLYEATGRFGGRVFSKVDWAGRGNQSFLEARDNALYWRDC